MVGWGALKGVCPSQHDTVQPTPHDRTTAEALPLAAARDTGQKGGREGGRGKGGGDVVTH